VKGSVSFNIRGNENVIQTSYRGGSVIYSKYSSS